MNIHPIHAGPVALAHALLVASCATSRSKDGGDPESPTVAERKTRFPPLHGFRQWWRGLDEPRGRTGNPLQLMLWAECWGRPYSASIGLVLINHLRKNRIKGP
jgi:hypothetical protein